MNTIRNLFKSAVIHRAKSNAHRYVYFFQGRLCSFTTRKEEVLSNLASLFGFFNQCSGTNLAAKASLVAGLGIALSLIPSQGYALPTGGTNVAGGVSFSTSGSTMNVSATDPRSIASYSTFNVANGETVNFNLPSAQSAILNRVAAGNPSQILGQINSNGQVFITNPSGIVFGNTAQVNVGSLFASTLTVSDSDFLANGPMVFNRTSPAAA